MSLAHAAPAGASAFTKYIQTADNFIVLFDTSGSMAGEYPPSKTSKLYAATDLLRAVNEDIPAFNYKAALCTFTPWKEYFPLGTYDQEAFGRAIDALPRTIEGGEAFGPPTPLGDALWNVGKMLKGLSGRTVVFIFVITSYSIHYTKLYDSFPSPTPSGRAFQRRQMQGARRIQGRRA